MLKGRYEIIKPLGSGNFGQTYLARDRQRSGVPYCVVKKLQPQQTDPYTLQKATDMFVREAKTLKILGKHDQIPSLWEDFQENQEFYIVQEWIDGHVLSEEFTGRQWTEKNVIQMLHDILEVLQFVHWQGVVHRDIKPSNIIRRKQDGKLVLIDFGAVKEVGSVVVNPQGQPPTVIGTPGYMPREQDNGIPEFASDVYAVGVMAIQAIAGLPSSTLSLLKHNNNGQIMWPNHISVSPQLRNIIDKMVRRDSQDRYPSAMEALQAIEDLIEPHPPAPLIKYAGFWRRFAADFIDKMILIIVSLIISLITYESTPDVDFLALWLFNYIIIGFVYGSVMDSSPTQGTLGKMAIGIAVTTVKVKRLTYEKASQRHVSKLISYLTILIGFVLAGVTKKKRTLHDIISGCIVIRRK
ncbi:MAG: RDD family protein [Hormoscilla sp. GUM202]|nr:RDD family protein [Hormoscilla sp. GUM202]